MHYLLRRYAAVLLGVLLCLTPALPVSVTKAATGISHLISLQGKVTNTDGTNVVSGSYSFTFSIYSVASAGTALWTETKSLTVTDGIFQTNLGSVTPLNGAVDFNTDTLYVGTNFNNDGEMTPRVQLTAVPQAYNAERVSGLTVSNTTGTLTIQNGTTVSFGNTFSTTGAFPLQLATTAATTATLPSGTVTLVDQATSQTLSNKTLSSPTIQGTVSAGTGLTLPSFTASGTIAGSSTLTLQSAGTNALSLDSTSTGSIQIGTSAFSKALTIGNQTTGTVVTLNAGATSTTNNNGVVIGNGSSLTSTTQINLVLDSSSTYAETASTCATTPTNLGALYYNSTTNSIRACINGGWEDLVSTAGLGLNLFGVVPDSGTTAEQGDLLSTTVNTAGSPLSGPCKVSWATTTSVTWRSCLAYSSGRKIIVLAPGSPLSITSTASLPWQHLCLTGTNGQPVFSAAAAAETSNLPAFSANNPILCLATVKNSGVASPPITNIFDTRTFTNSHKTFVTLNALSSPGWVVKQSATTNLASTTVTASDTNLVGVVAATSGTTSTTSVNAIVETSGPAFVVATGTSTVQQMAVSTTAAGYSATTTTVPGIYGVLGVAERTIDTACTATNNCQYSQAINLSIR